MPLARWKHGFAVHVCGLAWGLALSVPLVASAQTVGDHVGDGGCSTAVVRGLADQLVGQINCLVPGTLEPFEEGGQLVFASRAVIPALQTGAVAALRDALAARAGSTLTINSALRALPQQYLLYQWYRQGRCGIQIAASPGSSNHEGGRAMDVSEYEAWRNALEGHSWSWYGNGDRVHYTFVGPSEDIRSASVLAFQTLWNANHPEDRIGEDGDYGPETEGHLALAPAGGFPIATTCNPCEQGRHARFDRADAPAEALIGETVDVVATFTNVGESTWVAGQVSLATDPPVALDHDVIQGASASFALSYVAATAGPVTIPLSLVDASGQPLEAGCEGTPDGSVGLTIVEAPPGGGGDDPDPDDDTGDPDGTGDPGAGGDPGGHPGFGDRDRTGARPVGGLTGCAAAGGGATGEAGTLALALLGALVFSRRRLRAG